MATPEEYMEVFKKGTIVEVSSEDEGLRGSWYTATVLRSISNKSTDNYKMLVEYHNLMADDNPNKPLREFVDAILVRPIPPRDPPSRKYRLMEDVDAFHNDGWWEGVVTKVLESSSEGSRRYAVFFRCSREQIEFDPSDLRVHREWVLGDVWVTHRDLALSLRRKRKNGDGEERRNGSYSVDKNGVIENGEEREVGKRSRSVSSKPVALEKNKNSRESRRTNNLSGKKDAVTRKRKDKGLKNVSNGKSNKLGVNRNGALKEPRRRANKHAGCQQYKK